NRAINTSVSVHKNIQMSGKTLNVQRIAALLFILVVATWIFIIGKVLLSPLVFGVLLALMLKPVVAFWEKHVKSPVLSIVFTFLVVILPLIGLTYLIFWRTADIYAQLPSVSKKVE